MQPPQRVVAWALGMANFADTVYELREAGEVGIAKNGFLGADSEYDFGGAVEGLGFMGKPGASELQAMAAKGDFRGRQNGDFGLGHQGLNLRR